MPVPAEAGISVIREYGRGRPDPAVPRMPTDTVSIVSVYPRTAFSKTFQFGQYFIEPCPPCVTHKRTPCDRCDNYAILVVGAARDPIDDPNVTDGSGRRFGIILPGQVAEALTVEGCLDRGVFIAAGKEPTHEELEKARRDYRVWSTRMVEEADQIWNQKRDAAWIDPRARDAASYLGEKREWVSDTTKKSDCMSCGESVRAGAVVCPKCLFPVDWQKAFDRGMLTDRQESYGRKAKLFVDPEAEEKAEEASAERILSDQPKGDGRFKKPAPKQESAEL